ncbi:MAG: hypothetical protein M1337_06145, partial [Actinobacteria bacterium]|nr:hypothetical protein [Actinomycetota bacterium]
WLWLLVIVIVVFLSWVLIALRRLVFHWKADLERRAVSYDRANASWVCVLRKVLPWLDNQIPRGLWAYFVVLYFSCPTLFILAFNSGSFAGNASSIQNSLTSGLILGFAVTGFVYFQLPKLTSPQVYVSVLPTRTDGEGYVDVAFKRVDLIPSGNWKIFVQITNLGINHYDKCTCWLWLPKDLCTVLPAGSSPGTTPHAIDFEKPYEVQQQNNCAKFDAGEVAPGNYLVLPIWVRVNRKARDREDLLSVRFTSSSCFGEVTHAVSCHERSEPFWRAVETREKCSVTTDV